MDGHRFPPSSERLILRVSFIRRAALLDKSQRGIQTVSEPLTAFGMMPTTNTVLMNHGKSILLSQPTLYQYPAVREPPMQKFVPEDRP